MPIEVKSFASQADEAKDMPNARMEAVNVLGQRVMKLTLAPDWKWSKDIKPIVGTASCKATHVGVIIEGTIHSYATMAPKQPTLQVMRMRSRPTTTLGVSAEIKPSSSSLLVCGENNNVIYGQAHA